MRIPTGFRSMPAVAAPPHRSGSTTTRRRTSVRPDSATTAKGSERGWGGGGIPFPIPENDDGSVNPYKVLWNHLTRWRGISLTLLSSDTPVQIDGSYTLITTRQEVSFLMYNRDKQFKDIDNKLAYLIATITSPARLAG